MITDPDLFKIAGLDDINSMNYNTIGDFKDDPIFQELIRQYLQQKSIEIFMYSKGANDNHIIMSAINNGSGMVDAFLGYDITPISEKVLLDDIWVDFNKNYSRLKNNNLYYVIVRKDEVCSVLIDEKNILNLPLYKKIEIFLNKKYGSKYFSESNTYSNQKIRITKRTDDLLLEYTMDERVTPIPKLLNLKIKKVSSL